MKEWLCSSLMPVQEYEPAAVFTIKWLRQAMAMCECALYVSQVFSTELKLALPSSFFFFFFLVPPISFPCRQFFSLCRVSFSATEICIFVDNSHAWFFVFPLCAHSCLLEWTPYSLQTNPPATLFLWYFHSLSSLCAHTCLVRDLFLMLHRLSGTVSLSKLDHQIHSHHFKNLTSSSYPIDCMCMCARVCACLQKFVLTVFCSSLCAPIGRNST